MGIAALPLLLCLGQTASFEMTLAGTGVGWVRVELLPGQLRYQSEHVFRRSKAQTHVELALDEQGRAENESMPSARWLLRQPAPGCAAVFDEVTREKGEGCAAIPRGSISKGTLLRQSFVAAYDKQGLLERLTLGPTVFRRVDKVPVLDARRARVFIEGFPIEGGEGPLTLDPRPPGVRSPARAVRATAEQELNSGACLALAQAAMRENPGKWQLRLGLVADQGRAWPHAWLRDLVTGIEVDASAYGDKPSTQVPAGEYLLFPAAGAGQLYLGLLEGKFRVVRGRTAGRVK
jgi:hypothetical protein